MKYSQLVLSSLQRLQNQVSNLNSKLLILLFRKVFLLQAQIYLACFSSFFEALELLDFWSRQKLEERSFLWSITLLHSIRRSCFAVDPWDSHLDYFELSASVLFSLPTGQFEKNLWKDHQFCQRDLISEIFSVPKSDLQMTLDLAFALAIHLDHCWSHWTARIEWLYCSVRLKPKSTPHRDFQLPLNCAWLKFWSWPAFLFSFRLRSHGSCSASGVCLCHRACPDPGRRSPWDLILPDLWAAVPLSLLTEALLVPWSYPWSRKQSGVSHLLDSDTRRRSHGFLALQSILGRRLSWNYWS